MPTTASPAVDRLALWAHLVSAHAAIVSVHTSIDELAELHDREHHGPCGIRNHDPADLGADDTRIAEVLAEGVEVPDREPWQPPSQRWACELCWPDSTELAHIAPGLSLIVTVDGTHVLVGGQGHEPLVTFPAAPTPDPVTPELEDADDDAWPEGLAAASNVWVATAEAAMRPLAADMGLRGAAALLEDLRTAGYDPDRDGSAELWLYDRCGHAAAAAATSS